MKLKISPMDQVVKRAERRINLHRMVSPQDLAHDRKRQLANDVLSGANPTPEFAHAAMIEGLTEFALAQLIVSKPDIMMHRENTRRDLIVQVRSAKTPEEVEAILTTNGIAGHFSDEKPDML